MPQYNQPVNQDSTGKYTTCRYDDDAATWLQDSAMWVKNGSGIFVPVSETDPMPTKLTGSLITDEIIKNQNIIIKEQASKKIYGVTWDKGSLPGLTRINDAVGMVANAGVDFSSVTNDFDTAPIFGEIEEVEDDLSNVFVRIPKFYIRKMDGPNFRSWQVSKWRHPGFYLPWCFWGFVNKKELPYIDIGKYKASLGAGDKLESKPGTYPLVNTNIVNMRTYAQNNNAGGLLGYQQLDVHVVDVLRTLMLVEFATLDIQSIMQGYSTGQYSASHVATVTEAGTNRFILANAHADLFRVGQAISIGTSLGGNQICYGRTITSIDVYDASNKAIVFDGTAVDIAAGNIIYNTGWKNGFSASIAATSGSIGSNSDGKYPCVYRGIESPFGDIWQFVDGLNINERQAWVCKDAASYASNVFASPYEQLGYVNHTADGYVTSMGYDSKLPFVELPTAVGGGASTYYSDYYYQTSGQTLAPFGGSWDSGAGAGLSYWALNSASSSADVHIGGRLLKKPL